MCRLSTLGQHVAYVQCGHWRLVRPSSECVSLCPISADFVVTERPQISHWWSLTFSTIEKKNLYTCWFMGIEWNIIPTSRWTETATKWHWFTMNTFVVLPHRMFTVVFVVTVIALVYLHSSIRGVIVSCYHVKFEVTGVFCLPSTCRTNVSFLDRFWFGFGSTVHPQNVRFNIQHRLSANLAYRLAPTAVNNTRVKNNVIWRFLAFSTKFFLVFFYSIFHRFSFCFTFWHHASFCESS